MSSTAIWETSVEAVVTRIAEQIGIDCAQVEKAVGIILHLVKSEGDPLLVADLMSAVPGADELADAYATENSGLLGAMEGAPGSGAMAAFIKLWKAGLNPQQIRSIGELLFEPLMERAGKPLVKKVVGSIPGLKRHL